MSYRIITDSSCNLPDEIIERYGLTILSLRYMNDSIEKLGYSPDEPTNLQAFYQNMRNGVVYTTSLPYQQNSLETIQRIFEAGEDILYVGFSSAISGTFEATTSIVSSLLEQYPNRKARCIDTHAAALGEGLLVLYALDLQEAGLSLDQTADQVVDGLANLSSWFTVDDLMYLYRGGRVSRTSATAGNILSIKPVLHVDDEGRLVPMKKARGRSQSIQALFKQMKETFDDQVLPLRIAITHGDCIEDVEKLLALIKSDSQFADCEIVINQLDPVIGAHSGPGTLGLFFPATNRG